MKKKEIEITFWGETVRYQGKPCDCLDCLLNQRFIGKYRFRFWLRTPGPMIEVVALNHGTLFDTEAEAVTATEAEALVLGPLVSKFVTSKFGECEITLLEEKPQRSLRYQDQDVH